MGSILESALGSYNDRRSVDPVQRLWGSWEDEVKYKCSKWIVSIKGMCTVVLD